MFAYCQVWDAHWCMPGNALSSAQDGFFLRFSATSLMIQTTEVLGSSQVCFTQHTYPKFSPVKKRNIKAPTTPTGWVSPHHTDVQVGKKNKKKNSPQVESWIVSKRDEWCGGIEAHIRKERGYRLCTWICRFNWRRVSLMFRLFILTKILCWKMHF